MNISVVNMKQQLKNKKYKPNKLRRIEENDKMTYFKQKMK